jgi:hypothetical protein
MTRLLRRQSRRQVSGWSRYRKGRPVRRRVDAALTLASPVRMSVAVAAAAHRATFGVVMTAKEKLRVAVEELSETEAAEALGYIASRKHVFVAVGESTSGRTAVEAEDLLAEGFGR